MVQGIIKQWRTGCYMIYDNKKQFNHYLDIASVVEVETKGKWERIRWASGPGGMMGFYEDDRPVPDLLPARLVESR